MTSDFRTEHEEVLHRYFADVSLILEQMMTGTVIGSMLGLPGHGRRISFRILHVFEFREGLISRENFWLDSAAVITQLNQCAASSSAAGLKSFRPGQASPGA